MRGGCRVRFPVGVLFVDLLAPLARATCSRPFVAGAHCLMSASSVVPERVALAHWSAPLARATCSRPFMAGVQWLRHRVWNRVARVRLPAGVRGLNGAAQRALQ